MSPDEIAILAAVVSGVVSVVGTIVYYSGKVYRIINRESTHNGGFSIKDMLRDLRDSQNETLRAVEREGGRADERHAWNREEAEKQVRAIERLGKDS